MNFCRPALALLAVFSACRPKEQPVAFSLPKVPLEYRVAENYLRPGVDDTIARLDSAGRRVHVIIRLLDKKTADRWRIDTMHFRHKNSLSMWDTQKRGYYWIIQDLSAASDIRRDKEGYETEIHSRLDEYFMFQPVRQPERGLPYPAVNYKVMDEYWAALKADAVGISNPLDGELFVMAHPIKTRLRGKDQYQMISETDSVPVPYYYDRPDSGRLICLRVSVMELDENE